jgi:hypothetical protein
MTTTTGSGVSDRLRGVVFLVAGIGLLLAAAVAALVTSDFLSNSLLAPGVVTDERYGSHHVEVRFRTEAGETITYGQNGLVTLHKGERVMVRYDPSDPRLNPSVDQWPALWGVAIFLAILGSAFAITGGVVVARSRSVTRSVG